MTVEIAPTLHRSYETFVLLPASGTFSRKVKADHKPLTGMCTGREGRGCIHSQKNRLCQQTLLGIWRGGLARKTGSIAAKWRLSHPCSCYSFYMLTVAWSWIANQCNSGKLTKQFRNVDSSRSWLASSTCLSNQLTLTHTCTLCTSLHASRMTCMHLYTSLRVHRQTKMHTKTAKIPSYTNACTADSHPDWAGKVSKHGNTGSEWSPSSALQIGIQKMWEKCVNAWGECAWGRWKEFIHQWGGRRHSQILVACVQKYQLEYLWRVERDGEWSTSPAAWDDSGQEPVGRARCSARLNSRERGDVRKRSLLSCLCLFKAL